MSFLLSVKMETLIGSESDVDCDTGFATRRSVQMDPDEPPTDQHAGLNPRLFYVAAVAVVVVVAAVAVVVAAAVVVESNTG